MIGGFTACTHARLQCLGVAVTRERLQHAAHVHKHASGIATGKAVRIRDGRIDARAFWTHAPPPPALETINVYIPAICMRAACSYAFDWRAVVYVMQLRVVVHGSHRAVCSRQAINAYCGLFHRRIYDLFHVWCDHSVIYLRHCHTI